MVTRKIVTRICQLNNEQCVLPFKPYPFAFIASPCSTAVSSDQEIMLSNVFIPFINRLFIRLSEYNPNVFCVSCTFFICFLNCGINFKAIIITSDSLGMVLLNIYMNLSEVITILNALLQKITATSIIAIKKPYTNASSVIG